MATNFSPCKGSYVLNQFPSNVMFGINGFHVSASGVIQGHHGPLVCLEREIKVEKDLQLCTKQSGLSTTLWKKTFKNTVGEKENAGNQHFLLLPCFFLLDHREKLSF